MQSSGSPQLFASGTIDGATNPAVPALYGKSWNIKGVTKIGGAPVGINVYQVELVEGIGPDECILIAVPYGDATPGAQTPGPFVNTKSVPSPDERPLIQYFPCPDPAGTVVGTVVENVAGPVIPGPPILCGGSPSNLQVTFDVGWAGGSVTISGTGSTLSSTPQTETISPTGGALPETVPGVKGWARIGNITHSIVGPNPNHAHVELGKCLALIVDPLNVSGPPSMPMISKISIAGVKAEITGEAGSVWDGTWRTLELAAASAKDGTTSYMTFLVALMTVANAGSTPGYVQIPGPGVAHGTANQYKLVITGYDAIFDFYCIRQGIRNA